MNRWKLKLAWLWLCVFVFTFPALADVAGAFDSPVLVDVWSTKEGLPENSVISVIQTKDGYLWLGTLNGLVRFDGNHFTIFDENNTPGLSSERIVYLFEDSHTNLWIGTDNGTVAMAKDGRITNFQIGDASHEGRLLYAFEDPKGMVWFYTADGRTSRYQDGRMSFDPSLISTELVLRAAKILIPGQAESFWSMQNGRVQKWKNNQMERDLGICPWRINTIVTSACEDSNGNLIVGTLGEGVFWLDANGSWQHITTEQGLSSAFVLSLCLDREENLWVGTDGEGLDRIKSKTFSTPTEHQSWVVQSISGDASGGLWTAFNAHGVSYWITNSVQDFGVGRGSNAWTILVDHRQQVWAGTRGEGLFQFQTNHFQPAPGAEILGPQIFALFEDHRDGCGRAPKWPGALERTGLENFHDARGLRKIVRAIAEDAEGNLWIGTESHGLDFFKDGKFISYQKDGKRIARQRHFLSLPGSGRRLVGGHLRSRPGPLLQGKMDPLFHG